MALTRLLLRPWQLAATGGEGCPGLGPAGAVGPARQRWRRSWGSRRGAPRRRRGGRRWSRCTSLDHKQRLFTERSNMLRPLQPHVENNSFYVLHSSRFDINIKMKSEKLKKNVNLPSAAFKMFTFCSICSSFQVSDYEV